ncbi:MAG: hotdog domain-containing protein [Parcubacteria group bacterium]
MPELIPLSPIARMFGVSEVGLTDTGYTVISVPSADVANCMGRVSGGYLAMILDDTMSRHLTHVLGTHVAFTITLAVQFPEGASVGDTLLVTTRVLRTGDKVSFMEGTVTCGPKILTTASASFGNAVPCSRRRG